MPWKEFAGYQVMTQSEGYSCGMSCVAMMVHLTQGGLPSEASVKQLSQGIGGAGYKPAIADRAWATQPRMLTATAAPAEDTTAGTGMQNLSQVLTACHVNNTLAHHANLAAAIHAIPRDKPMILHLDWAGGGGHFVVAQVVHDKLLVRDPASGVNVVDIGPNYAVGVATGNFSGWVIRAT